MATGKAEQVKTETNGDDGGWLYRAAKAQGGDTQWPARASTKPRVATGATGSQEKDADGAVRRRALFHLIIELPFVLKSKLLPNLYNNSKISKNKSFSKFKVLQLCFYNHTQIQSTF